MITMIDMIFDREYQARRVELNAALSSGLDGFRDAVRNAFVVLNRMEYDAPWRRSAGRSRPR
jgi:hypothetical protein